MIESELLKLLRGERGALSNTKQSQEFLDKGILYSKLYDVFKNELNPSAQLQLISLTDAANYLQLSQLETYYFEGFKFGILLGLELANN